MAKKEKLNLQSPKGMHDLLSPDTLLFERIHEKIKEVANYYQYSLIETPVVESRELFERGVGEDTDIVTKEMYTLTTKGGDKLALRPEGTAGVVRAYIQNGLFNYPQPVKLWYWGPMLRHESPQAGRFRQFYQAGLEYFGEEHPSVDVEVIQTVKVILEDLGLRDFEIQVNSIGCNRCRITYKSALKSYYRSRYKRLCPDCKERFKSNPMRLLDCKNETCLLMKSGAPETVEHLCEECRLHFKSVLDFLDDLEFPYQLNPHLVRGLDYYSRTVFEFVPVEASKGESSATEPKKGLAVASGGRYDYLVETLGGPKTPAVGVALGIERLMDFWKDKGLKLPPRQMVEVFAVQVGNLAKKRLLKLIEELRLEGVSMAMTIGRDSLKAQLKVADRTQARFALILGQKEALDGTMIIRDMRTGVQETIRQEHAVKEIKERLRGKGRERIKNSNRVKV